MKRKSNDKEFRPTGDDVLPDDDEITTEDAETSHKKPKLADYEFTKEDVEAIEEGIVEYGLNYKSIHERFFNGKTSLNKLKTFINSPQMAKVKQFASEGIF